MCARGWALGNGDQGGRKGRFPVTNLNPALVLGILVQFRAHGPLQRLQCGLAERRRIAALLLLLLLWGRLGAFLARALGSFFFPHVLLYYWEGRGST